MPASVYGCLTTRPEGRVVRNRGTRSTIPRGVLDDHTSFHRRVKVTEVVITTRVVKRMAELLTIVKAAGTQPARLARNGMRHLACINPCHRGAWLDRYVRRLETHAVDPHANAITGRHVHAAGAALAGLSSAGCQPVLKNSVMIFSFDIQWYETVDITTR